MEDNGEGGVVLFSLFEEPISKEEARLKNVVSTTTNSFAEATDYFPDLQDFSVDTNEYLEYIRKAKQRVKFPIIGSLNGITIEGWIDYSSMWEQAGADGIEVNSKIDLSFRINFCYNNRCYNSCNLGKQGWQQLWR